MTEEVAAALDVAAPEVVTPETEQDVKPEGQVETPPASETEDKTESQKRRERRKAQELRHQEEFNAAQQKASDAQAKLDRIKASAQGVEPKETDFTDIGEYWAAKGAWNYAKQMAQIQVGDVSAEAEQAKATLETQRVAHRTARQAEFQAECQTARTRYQDFDSAMAVATNAQFVSVALADILLESEQPADLAYYLGKNPQIAAQLSAMPPIQAAREIGKLEAGLSFPRARSETKAPDPINPVRGNAGTRSPDKMTASEYAAWRAAGGTFTL